MEQVKAMEQLSSGAQAQLADYLRAVSMAMEQAGADRGEIEAVTEGLRDQVLATLASRSAWSEPDMADLLKTLDPPSAFAGIPDDDVGTGQAPGRSMPTLVQWLGAASALFSVASLALGLALSQADPFDNDMAGTIFVFGQIFALAAGLTAHGTLLGRFGALASGLMLAFLAAVLLLR